MPGPISIVEADLERPDHQAAVVALTDAYSRDPFGDGKPLDPVVRERLIPGLRSHPSTLIMLAFDGERPVGMATCFVGFSTFSAKPLVNIHDLVVVEDSRGRGVGRSLLDSVERKARELGCCKITLEVLDKNARAIGAYRSFGFAQYSLQEGAGVAIFMAKPLAESGA
jgi:ribosomal protein S18 acetylase RimI-like enzyme